MKNILFIVFIALFFFQSNAQTWNETAKLVASDRNGQDRFGWSVSINENHGIVGAYHEGDNLLGVGSAFGAAYIFEKDNIGNWDQGQKLVASDREYGDYFGWSVSISENYAIVSARDEDEDAIGGDSLSNPGSAYIFEKDASGNWEQVQKIVASDRSAADVFGWSVAINGTSAIVSAYREDEDTTGGNTLSDAGSVYIFERDSSGIWVEIQKIVASDRDIDDHFGFSVSLDGIYLVVGANTDDENSLGVDEKANAGAAYIFEKDSIGNWNQIQKIVALDRSASDLFGGSVSLHGNFALIGASREDESASGGNTKFSAGSAYIFERDTSGIWIQNQKIVASDRDSEDYFGKSVSINGNYAVVGAYGEDENTTGGSSMDKAGSAYLFNKGTNGEWEEVQKVVSSDRTIEDEFGFFVAISSNTLLIGAHDDDDENAPAGTDKDAAGAVYTFELSTASSISKNDFGPALSIYPNPNSGKLTVELGQVYHEVEITVRNLIGQAILTQSSKGTDQFTLEIEGPSGIYLLDIRTSEGKTATSKIMKE